MRNRIFSIFKDNKIQILEYFILSLLMAVAIHGLLHSTEAEYQMIKDRYLYRGYFCFLLCLLINQRIKICKLYEIIPLVAFSIIFVAFLVSHKCEHDVYMVYVAKFHTYASMGLLIIDAIFNNRIAKIKDRNMFFNFLFVFVVIFITITSPYRSSMVHFYIPFAALYAVKITAKEWYKLMLCLAIGYVICVFYTMGYSLLNVPYTPGRYSGVFINLPTITAFYAGGCCCALFLFLNKQNGRYKNKAHFISSLLILALSYIFASMCGAKSSLVPLIIVIFVAGVIIPDRYSKLCEYKRIAVGGTITVIVVFGFIICSWGMSQLYITIGQGKDATGLISYKVLYWLNRAYSMYNTKSIDFGSGNVLAIVDRALSDRLTIWHRFSGYFNLLGHGYINISYRDSIIHAHSTFVSWIFTYGVIGGILLIGMFIYGLFWVICKVVKNNRVYFFSFIWMLFTLLSFLTDTHMWNWLLPTILLVSIYPILVNVNTPS